MFINHQFSWQGDDLQALIPDAGGTCDVALGVAANDVVARGIFVHHVEENLLDTRAFLIDGIVERIHEMIHALDDLFLVHQFRSGHIITRQFRSIIRESLELDALRMRPEEQIDGLMHRLKLPEEAKQMYALIKSIDPNIMVEVSGRVTMDNIGDYADCADRISMGALTHSVKAAHFSLALLN